MAKHASSGQSRKAPGRMDWLSLDQADQIMLLQATWLKHAPRLRSEFPSLLSVGLGHKVIEHQRHEHLCVSFLVSRKDPGAQPLPRFLRATLSRQGRRYVVDVPTDVTELGAARPQLDVDVGEQGIYVAVTPNTPSSASGAVCCLVNIGTAPDVYLLSCNHVLGLTKTFNSVQANADAKVYTPNWDGPFAALTDAVTMVEGVPGQLDAAIALVLGGNVVGWSNSNVMPSSVATGEVAPQECQVYTPRGPVPLAYYATYPDIPLAYEFGIFMFSCYCFQGATQDGDSGSPVIDSEGVLHGMHFYGDPAGNGGKGLAYAMPAGQIFAPGIFSVGQLTLAS